jgi:hypothetical protein
MDTFSSLDLGPAKIDGYEAVTAIFGCGVLDTFKGTDSETTLIIFIKGEKDYYTLQWAERGQLSSSPLSIDEGKWRAKFEKLMPVKLTPPPESPPSKQN